MTDPDPAQDLIEHFGTKGMRWGVRNDKPVSSNNSSKQNDKIGNHAEKQIQKLAGKSGDLTTAKGRRKQDKIDSERFGWVFKRALAKPLADIYTTRDGQDFVFQGRDLVNAGFGGARITYDQIRLTKERSSEPMVRVERQFDIARFNRDNP
jgi:hypothetical protein